MKEELQKRLREAKARGPSPYEAEELGRQEEWAEQYAEELDVYIAEKINKAIERFHSSSLNIADHVKFKQFGDYKRVLKHFRTSEKWKAMYTHERVPKLSWLV